MLLGCFWGATGGLGAHLRGLWVPIGGHWELSGIPSGVTGSICRLLWAPLGGHIMQLAGFGVLFLGVWADS